MEFVKTSLGANPGLSDTQAHMDQLLVTACLEVAKNPYVSIFFPNGICTWNRPFNTITVLIYARQTGATYIERLETFPAFLS